MSGMPAELRPAPQKRGAAAPAPPDTLLSKRRAYVKRIVTSIQWELGMLCFVLLYFVVVFVTFALADQQVRERGGDEHGVCDQPCLPIPR